MACNIKYISETYKEYPKLVEKLTDIEIGIWNKLKNSGLFRDYEKTLLFSKKNTDSYKKQKNLLSIIDKSLNATSTLFREIPTKSGFSPKIRSGLRLLF